MFSWRQLTVSQLYHKPRCAYLLSDLALEAFTLLQARVKVAVIFTGHTARPETDADRLREA